MSRRRGTQLLERPDAAGGVAVLADGIRVYWDERLGRRLVVRPPAGADRVVLAAGGDPAAVAFAELCDRGAAVSRRLTAAETRRLDGAVGAAARLPVDRPGGAQDSPSSLTE